jgi:SAM-dependent methyltransferase
MPPKPLPDCYDYPRYWDLAFRSETKLEADFIEAACRKYVPFPVRRLLEPGCGGGRLVVEMAARGYEVTGIDLSDPSVAYVKKRLRRRGLRASVLQADMTEFVARPPVDAAFCTFNTFRHLTSEAAARGHLQAIAESLRPGGIYILGFHLLPPDADEECVERWSARHGRTRVNLTLRVLDCDRRRRLETIRFSLRVHAGQRELRLQSDYQYRLYTAAQFRRLLRSVPQFELCEVFDFWYESEQPLSLDDTLADALFVLRRRS